ncbi:tRNA intron endonuclease, catalytic-like protein [Staphylothermus marinus F1]|uniref:tRNA intron endonuclease, catalytic-like protein n=1 Tax=Staphylothermus marinus (strain ATCC 43588 / DSM 3639 / JCM 9404 / F1) TaxID=399550 RepID=A3DN76_STAMF|nr:endonuclease [Staphylothermus marinus]ABN70086.1 tRNA intron endonuclease, catalytic-like protein [Staphylothermus marinus F1]
MKYSYIVWFDQSKCIGIVKDKKSINNLEKKWFGRLEGENLVLDIVELAYLLLHGRIRLVLEGLEITTYNEFLEKNYGCLKQFFWPKLVVYKDLRDRGRKVRVIDDKKFLVKDKHGDLKLVVILEEGSKRPADTIIKDIETAHSNNLELIYAIVSLQGDLTYYEVSKIDPRNEQ